MGGKRVNDHLCVLQPAFNKLFWLYSEFVAEFQNQTGLSDQLSDRVSPAEPTPTFWFIAFFVTR